MNSVASPRIAPVPMSDWNDEILDALGAFPAGLAFVQRSRQAGEAQPRGVNVLGLLARHPQLAKAFLAFNAHMATTGSLTPRMRELVILRMSWLKGSDYEFAQHKILGRRAGLTEQELEWLQAPPATGKWARPDAAVLRAMDELHADTRISEGTWQELEAQLDAPALLDLLFLAGCYATLGMVLNSVALPLEASASRP